MSEYNAAGMVSGARVRGPEAPAPARGGTVAGPGFEGELRECGLKLSRHAQDRIRRRGIELGEPEMARLEKAVEKAESKGGRSSLVLMDELAFVVNVAARQIVTACSQERLREGVFTNIDSTVIVGNE